MRVRPWARCAFVAICLVGAVASGAPKKSRCSTEIAGATLAVTPAAKEALVLAGRTGILEARIILQIPTAARGVLPPYVQLLLQRDRLKAALEKTGATVTVADVGRRTVARLELRVVGPLAEILPLVAGNPWVRHLATDSDLAPGAPVPASANHAARETAARAFARAEALKPSAIALEDAIVQAIREGYAPQPDATDVQLLATVGPSSLFLATLPVDRDGERRTVAFLVRVDQRSDALDAVVERVLKKKELAALLPKPA